MVTGEMVSDRAAATRPESLSLSRPADPSRGPFLSASWLTDDQLRDPGRARAAHPDLPRGLFELIWRHLASEQVACYYSRRADTEGWALNVIVRVGDRLLVVALSPRSVGHLAHSADLCNSALAAERRQTLAGTPDRAVEAGTQYLLQRLASAGHEDPAAWMATILSAEGALLGEQPSELPRPSRAVGPLSALLLAVHNLRADCDPLMRALPAQAAFTRLLDGARDDVEVTRTILPALADAAASVGGAEHDHERVVLANTGTALQKLAHRMDRPLARTRDLMERTRHQVDRVRMATVAAHFVAEAVAAIAVDRIVHLTTTVGADLSELCRALEQAVSDMAVEAANLAEDLGPLGQACEQSEGELTEFQRWVSRYRLRVAQLPDATRLADLTAAMDQHLAIAEDSLFTQVLQACHELPVGFDVERLVQHLHEVREAGTPRV